MNDARAAGASGFVDRLVVKAFGGAEVAAARVPSAYEPVRPQAGLASGAQRGRIDEDVLFGDDAMDGDPHEASGRQHGPESARMLAADGSRSVGANAAEEGERATAARPRHRRTRGRGDAANGGDAGSPSAHAIDGDGDVHARALVPTPMLSDSRGSRPGAHSEDAASSIARDAFNRATPNSSGSGEGAAGAAWAATNAEGFTPLLQPSARVRAALDASSLDWASLTRESGSEDAAAAARRGRGLGRGRRTASETSASEGILMPLAHGGTPHAADGRAGWRESASRRANADSEAGAGTHDVTVNVTIGRVDVRAVQAAAPTERPAARTRGAQPIALDEYLARHGGAR